MTKETEVFTASNGMQIRVHPGVSGGWVEKTESNPFDTAVELATLWAENGELVRLGLEG